MTKNEFKGTIPLCFRIVELWDRYEIPCRNCSFQEWWDKKRIRSAIFDGLWHNNISSILLKHQDWHDEHPSESYDEFKKKQLEEASRQAIEKLNLVFRKYFR